MFLFDSSKIKVLFQSLWRYTSALNPLSASPTKRSKKIK